MVDPPKALSGQWQAHWKTAYAALVEAGVWRAELKVLLDEYVLALREAYFAREAGRHTDWDRHVKRACALADQLALTPRGRKAAGIGDSDDEPVNPFDELDELAERREKRVA